MDSSEMPSSGRGGFRQPLLLLCCLALLAAGASTTPAASIGGVEPGKSDPRNADLLELLRIENR